MRAPSEFTPRSVPVLLAALVAAMVSGFIVANVAITVFMANIAADNGWSRAQISAAVTLLLIGMGAGAPFFGPIVDRRGARLVLLPLTLLSGLLLASFSLVGRSLPLFYVAHFLLGFSTPGAVAYSKLISSWFFRRRGIALTALGGGAFVGSVVIPVFAHLLLTRIGWQQAYLVFGATELLIALPVLYLFFRERGSETYASGLISNEIRPDGAPSIAIVDAVRSRTYWLILAAQITGMFAQYGLAPHAIGIMSERGLDAATATVGVSILAFGGLVAQFATGYLLDRYDTPRVILPFAIISVISLALLSFSHALITVFLSLALFGFGCGGQTSMTSYFTTRYFGVRNFSTIYGSILPVLLLLSAPGPIVVGAIFDRTGGYGQAFILLEFALLASVALFLRLPSYPYPVRQSEGESSEVGSLHTRFDPEPFVA